MHRWSMIATVVATMVLGGCYHQVVRTGAPPGSVTLERPWTATYFFGLVPASAINTAAQCPAGVAVVETQQSFMNGLVGVLTLGIYTPQTVTITCAAGGASSSPGRSIILAADADPGLRAEGIRAAIDLARETGESVVVFALSNP